MQITPFALGPFQTNCYVVHRDGAQSGAPCWIIDASFEATALIDHVKQTGLRVEALIFTHAHIDHIAGAFAVVRELKPGAIMIHDAERAWLSDATLNLSEAFGLPTTAPDATRILAEGETLTLDGSSWRVLHTPGHSPGSITLVNDETHQAISGDTLFAGSIGRYDFPGCSFDVLADSIRTKLYTLPDETKVYPGHGPTTTIGREKRSNPFVRP